MRVTFYRNSSDKKAVRKSLSMIKTVDCWVKGDCDMLHPSINIERSALINFNGVNYMYIDTFDRYYNISDVTVKSGDFIEVSGDVDPLQSNQSAILSLNCVVLRQERKYNLYYQDSELPIRSQKTFVRKIIGSLPNVTTNILTVDGG